MAEQYKFIKGGVSAPKGFRAGGIHAGFKKNQAKKDLSLIYSEVPCAAAGAFTANKVKGAPILVTKKHLASGRAQAIVANSGNANTCAPNGVKLAEQTCKIAAEALGLKEQDLLVCSTGVIGQELSIEPFKKGVPKLAKLLLEGKKVDKHYGSAPAAEAIMTTDTVLKEVAVQFSLAGKTCKIGGIAKGSGMINPNMATMLAFITTDANISPALLKETLKNDIKQSFNQISVDGDTSTNDTVLILANGLSGAPLISKRGKDFRTFSEALNKVTKALAKMLAKDGEGATKLIECAVKGAPTEELAMRIAKTVIQSDLVKTAIFGEDANWGRVLCAVGYTQGKFSADKADVELSSKAGSILVCKGSLAVNFDEKKAKKILAGDEILISLNLHDGKGSAEAYGCDLTYNYVRINGAYRT